MGLTKTRELVKEMFVQALSNERLPWQMPWQNHLMYNPKSGTIYSGINQFVLSYIAGSRGYEDPRWLTFNQIAKSPDLHLMKGSKGAPVEYWAIYDKLAKKNISLIDKIKVCAADPSREEDMVLKGRTYYVFNGQCIEGMPPIPEIDNGTMANQQCEHFVQTYCENTNTTIIHSGDSAFYRPATDEIYIPNIQRFKDQGFYYGTLTHEIAHSTMHPSRLNRDAKGLYGSEDYAIEELRAEIASTFMQSYLPVEFDEKHAAEHIAYVQSWLTAVNKDENILFRSIKDAEKISDYMCEMGGINLNEMIQDSIIPEKEKEQQLIL